MMRIGSSDAYELPGGNEGADFYILSESIPEADVFRTGIPIEEVFERLLHGKLLVMSELL